MMADIGDRKRTALKLLRGVLYFLVLILLLVVGMLFFFNNQRQHREIEEASLAAPKTGRFIDTADARVFIQEQGSSVDQAVILIHGTGTWSEIWKDSTSVLVNAGFRVIAIDLPPFGYSEKLASADSYSRQNQAKRIVGVLDALQIKKAILVGHSVGGRPTLEVALMAPERVRKLVLVDPALGFQADPEIGPHFQQNDASWLVSGFFLIESLRDAVLSTYGTNPIFLERLTRSFVSNKESVTDERVKIIERPMSVKGTTEAYGDWLRNLTVSKDNSLGSDFNHFKNLEMPVLLIWGSTDTITPLWQGQALSRLIPGSELSVIDDVGHIPYIENVDTFNSTLIKFLRK